MNRQESLFAIAPQAVKAAKEHGAQIAIVHAPAYVDDYNEGVHVFCPKEAIDVLYPPRAAWQREIEAVVEKDGSVFFTKVEDVLESIRRHKGRFIRIEVEPETPHARELREWQEAPETLPSDFKGQSQDTERFGAS